MNVVDSSAWLEYVSDGPNAAAFAKAIEHTELLVVPSITIFEVFKRLLSQRDKNSALRVIAHMRQGKVIPLDSELAISAAQLGVITGLPLADSVILATARAYDAVLWTQDKHFDGVAGVRYFQKHADKID